MKPLALVHFALLLGGCATSSELRPPPGPPRLEEPILAIPADLDIVVRIDLERAQSALGEDLRAGIERLLRSGPDGATDASTSRLLLALVAKARTAWIGVRPGLSAELTDNVIVLRGDFAEVFPGTALGGEPPWSAAQDLGGGTLRFDRDAPKLRAAPSILYYAVPDRVVFGSYAEIDALERTVERGQGPALDSSNARGQGPALDSSNARGQSPALVPPETGIASLSARLDGLLFALRRRAKAAAKLLEGAEELSASASWTGTAFDLRGDLRFDSEERARETARVLGALAAAFAEGERAWLGSAVITPVGNFVGIRLELPVSVLAREFKSGTVAP